ncbi:tannase/feruloyl esterase family alpha/beta hydrolase [Micromonospora costi]|uniref:tannase/feruloyl esterase family alpha/beta hydrolase n=1 Tax=Micromonospora costi TaxID=1530042 RepID=UPI001319D7FA|nr:tannase/feruloyl esterase family alpha/beta hydrolase [Micromonospora costi]
MAVVRLTRLVKLAVLVPVVAVSVSVLPAAAGAVPRSGPARSCASLTGLSIANTAIDSAVVVPASGATPEYCAVRATVSNPPTYSNAVRVGVFLPTRGWNGRFVGTGGGGFSGGNPNSPDAAMVQAGYATAGTDAGHAGASGSFALNADRTLNWPRIDDFGFLGIHNMTVVAKEVVNAFYGKAAEYSYFNGCSTGGRQGLIEAQRYPTDYDGIAAASPAINSQLLRTVQAWGQMQMQLAGNFLPQCKFDAFNQAAITACDNLDRVTDGIISDWKSCQYDARRLVGTVTPCGTITAADADIVNKIWQGPVDPKGNSLWFGLLRGTRFNGLNNTVTTADGTTTGSPFAAMNDWYRYFLNQDPNWDWRTLTYDQFLRAFQQAGSQYADFDVTAADRIDLTPYRDAGGKLVMWAGASDEVVYQQGTVDYYERVKATVGGAKETEKFARFFFAPGVEHCGGGVGAEPTNAFQAVVDWVEHGKAPSQLTGEKVDADGNVVMTRPVCMYPQVASYKGKGDTNTARNFQCKNSF